MSDLEDGSREEVSNETPAQEGALEADTDTHTDTHTDSTDTTDTTDTTETDKAPYIPIKNFSRRDVKQYRICRELSGSGKHARGIQKLVYRNDYIIKKVYGRSKANIFWNEIYWLIRLAGSGFTPRLIRVDAQKLTFWMTYCGEPVPKTQWRGDVKKEIRRMQEELLQKYQVYHNDIKEGNITATRKGQLYLIDLGWAARYPLEPGYGRGKWGEEHPACFTEIRDKCVSLLRRKPCIWPYNR